MVVLEKAVAFVAGAGLVGAAQTKVDWESIIAASIGGVALVIGATINSNRTVQRLEHSLGQHIHEIEDKLDRHLEEDPW